MKMIPFTDEYIEATKLFADEFIGTDYYSQDDLKDIIKRSEKDGKCSSILLINDANEVLGMRLSYPQGQWLDLKSDNKICPEKWNVQKDEMAYFQSIFLSDKIQGQGWGQKLSLEAMKTLKEVGAKAIVCHSWKESPHNSSMRYLEKLGFQPVHEHKKYWYEVDYVCVRCGKPCLCTATEMVFYL